MNTVINPILPSQQWSFRTLRVLGKIPQISKQKSESQNHKSSWNQNNLVTFNLG